MKIITPSEPEKTLWDGALEPEEEALGPVLGRTEKEKLRVSIGRPVQWAENQLMGEKWKPPARGDRHYLVRLAFTLWVGKGETVSDVEFCLKLHPQGSARGMVFDAYPREQLIERPLPVKLGLGPTFKLGAAEAELASAETTIDFGYVYPVITTVGLQEAEFCWRYRAHRRQPLAGSRMMYAVVALPKEMSNALATLELLATREGRFGPLHLSTSETARQNLRWVVGEEQGL